MSQFFINQLNIALGFISFSEDVIAADRNGCSPYDAGGAAIDEIRTIKSALERNDKIDEFI